MLNLNSIMLGSEDPQKLAKFYEEVLQSKPGWQDNGYIGFQAGTCYLTVGPHDKVKGKSPNPERILFFFETKDVDAEFDRIKAIDGVEVIQAPYHPGPNAEGTLATLADPDGNYFQLNTPFEM